MIGKYLDDRNNLDQVVLTLSQCRGTLASLTLFKEEEGILILDAMLETLAKDEEKLLVESKALDVKIFCRVSCTRHRRTVPVLKMCPPRSMLALFSTERTSDESPLLMPPT